MSTFVTSSYKPDPANDPNDAYAVVFVHVLKKGGDLCRAS